jgi:hypothetical protein
MSTTDTPLTDDDIQRMASDKTFLLPGKYRSAIRQQRAEIDALRAAVRALIPPSWRHIVHDRHFAAITRALEAGDERP